MAWVLFADQAQPGRVEKLDSGAVRVRGRVSRTGVQSYAPWPGAPVQDRAIKVYRPPEQVFSDDSVSTLKGSPVVVGHPPERRVTADNWRRYAVGHNEGETERVEADGSEYLEASIVVSDAEAVKRLLDKDLTEISQGYTVELDWTPGTTNDGKAYDAVQTQIVHNHTALLAAGAARAGHGARVLLDSNVEEKHMDEKEFKAALKKALETVDAKKRKAVGEYVSGTVAPMCDAMSEEEVSKLIEHAIKAAVAQMSEESEEDPEEEPEDSEDDEEEKKRKAAATDSKAKSVDSKAAEKRGEELAKQVLADSKTETLAVIDARAEVAGMVAKDYDPTGKTVRELQLDALDAVAPKLRKQFTEDTSDAEIAGAFRAVKANRASWITTDEVKPPKPGEHIERYQKRMNDAFEQSWGRAS